MSADLAVDSGKRVMEIFLVMASTSSSTRYVFPLPSFRSDAFSAHGPWRASHVSKCTGSVEAGKRTNWTAPARQLSLSQSNVRSLANRIPMARSSKRHSDTKAAAVQKRCSRVAISRGEGKAELAWRRNSLSMGASPSCWSTAKTVARLFSSTVSSCNHTLFQQDALLLSPTLIEVRLLLPNLRQSLLTAVHSSWISRFTTVFGDFVHYNQSTKQKAGNIQGRVECVA